MKTYDELLVERDDAMREASGLAMSIWRSEFRNESPEFDLCDSPAGVITQIDNMFAGVRQQRDALAAQVELMRSALELARISVRTCYKQDEAPFSGLSTVERVIKPSPQQFLAEIKAEAGRDGFIACAEWVGDSEYENDKMLKAADQYAAKIRNTGTWLKDSNVNGGKRQGGE